MATMTCDFFSFVLQKNVTINVFVPTPTGNEQITDKKTTAHYGYDKGLPVLYLLHGAYGNHSSWMRFSSVERYAQEYGCALVMASAGNNFYQDMVHGDAYYTFFTKELPEMICTLFPVSRKREDTYVAGFSMGGYGAWYLGLSRPDLYSKAASMSGALDIVSTYANNKSGSIDGPFDWEAIFGTPDTLEGSSADLFRLYDNCAAAGQIPDLYQACGTKDFLYQMNLDVKKRMEEKGAQITYEEESGSGHEWDFWDKYIRHILHWIFS